MAKASTGKNKAAGGKRGAPANRASMSYETIDVAVRNAVAIVVLNRPDVHNAFNETLISELTAALRAMDSDPEVRAALIPATTSPYVIAAIGVRAARRYFLSAERFTAAEAYRLGLLHDLALPEELDARVNELLGTLLTAGPRAQAECKLLLRAIANRPVDARLIADTARRIARVRSSPEGREGIAAFLAKRKAAWVPRGE